MSNANESNVVQWDPDWKNQLDWQTLENPPDAPAFFDDLIAAAADGPAETYAVMIQPLTIQGTPGLMLRVISERRPEDDLILNMVAHNSNTWPDTIKHLRETFHKQIFAKLAAALRLEIAMASNPDLQAHGPARTRLRDEIAAYFEAGLTEQLEVKRPGRAARSSADDRRALLEKYKVCTEAIKTGSGLPSWVSRQLNKRGRQDPWKIALRWAANEQRLNYKLSYLEKILTRAKKENPDLARTLSASLNSTLERPLALSVAK